MEVIPTPNPERIRLIISDLDGTLLNSKHQPSEKTIQTIKAIIEKYKINFVIATGKSHGSSLFLRKKLNLVNRPNCPSIHNNGSIIYDSKSQVIQEYFLDPEIVIKNIDLYKSYLKGRDYSYTVYSGETIYCPVKDRWSKLLIDYNEKVDILPEKELIERIQTNALKVNKICLLTFPEIIDEMTPILRNFTKPYSQIGITRGNSCCLETLDCHSNKGQALKTIMNLLKVKPDQVMAFGDGVNDITMFQTAGYKYAMGNCVNELKDLSTYITKTNDEDGMAYILEQTFLKEDFN